MIEKMIERARGGFYYLASPYTHPNSKICAMRVEEALAIYARLVNFGVIVYHATHSTHHAALMYNLPTDYMSWSALNSSFIRASAGIIVAGIEGWQDSEGVAYEIAEARSLGKPVFLVNKRTFRITELTEGT